MVDKERRGKKCREAGNFLKVYVKDIPGLRTHLSPNVPMSKDWMTCPSPSSWRVMYQGQRTGQTGSKASSSFALWRALTKYTWFSSLGQDGIGVREGLLHFWVFRERRNQLNIFPVVPDQGLWILEPLTLPFWCYLILLSTHSWPLSPLSPLPYLLPPLLFLSHLCGKRNQREQKNTRESFIARSETTLKPALIFTISPWG